MAGALVGQLLTASHCLRSQRVRSELGKVRREERVNVLWCSNGAHCGVVCPKLRPDQGSAPSLDAPWLL